MAVEVRLNVVQWPCISPFLFQLGEILCENNGIKRTTTDSIDANSILETGNRRNIESLL